MFSFDSLIICDFPGITISLFYMELMLNMLITYCLFNQQVNEIFLPNPFPFKFVNNELLISSLTLLRHAIHIYVLIFLTRFSIALMVWSSVIFLEYQFPFRLCYEACFTRACHLIKTRIRYVRSKSMSIFVCEKWE